MSVTFQNYPYSTNVPIGAVLQWFGSLAGVPALPSSWQLCDGSLITDGRSPMVGQNTPFINGTTNDDKRFIRGSTTSGSTGGQALQGTHTVTGGGGSNATPGLDSNLPPFIEAIFIMRIY